MKAETTLKVGIAQIAPVWLDKAKTIEKVLQYVSDAADQGCKLVSFGEALLPGYPHWTSFTDGALFNSSIQKEIHAYYAEQSIEIQKGDLAPICAVAKSEGIAVYLGTIERAVDRGGHSLYCSLVYIDQQGIIQSVHRKLRPTYEERLSWSPGDGHGLRVHALGAFTAGGLNCWENWMPMSRTALYGMGENLHVAVWPGSERNTKDITRFIAMESRSYVISASALMTKKNIHAQIPHAAFMQDRMPEVLTDGGSCIADPDGNWLIEPVVDREVLLTAELDFNKVLQARQNLDPAGHYSRPDVTKLIVNRERQSIISIEE
jgi:nitrilase